MDRRSFLAGLGSLAATLLHLEEAVAAAGSDGQRVPALRLLGGAHQAAGESAFDRLDLTAATEHFHQAYEIGVELGDADMVAAAMIQLGDVARRRRRYGAALQLLDRAERPASAASLLTQVRRLQTLARTHAEVGDRSPFDAAIGRADDLAAQIPAEHHRLPDHSPRGLRLERGQGLTLLGQAASALAIYDDVALDQLVDERERGSFRIVQAQALAHAGELDEGVRVAVEGLGLARGYGSPRHVSRVQRMYDRLARRWTPAEPALADLRDALAA